MKDLSKAIKEKEQVCCDNRAKSSGCKVMKTGEDHRNAIVPGGSIPDGSIPDAGEAAMIAGYCDPALKSPTERISEAVKRIPKGCVATYAEVAEAAGNRKMARAVGNALHKNPDPKKIPCHRVVNAKGELAGKYAFGGAVRQAELLVSEGLEIVGGRVDLKKYGCRLSDKEN